MTKLVLSKNLWLKRIIYTIVDLPVVRRLYLMAYLIKINRVLRKRELDTLSIEPKNVCNLSCIMCPYPQMKRPKVELGLEEYEKIITELPSGNWNICLSIYNEPFLDRLLIPRIKFAKKAGHYVFFFSNGTLLNNKNIELILENPPDKIVFSVDADSNEVYTKIRINGNYDIVKDNILSLIHTKNKFGEYLPKVQVNILQMESNKKNIASAIQLWTQHADDVVLGAVDNRAGNHSQLKLRVKESSRFIFPCPRAFYDPGVLSDGRVTFCACQDYDGIGIIGDTKKNSIRKILQSEEYNRIKRLHLEGRADEIGLCSCCTYLNKPFLWWGM